MTAGGRVPKFEVTFRHQQIAELNLPTGDLVACDPFCLYTPVAFVPRVEPGRYPVSVAVAEYESKDERVALAILRLAEYQPVRWEMATSATHGPNFNIFAPHGIYKYSVDYACGSFMDLKTAQVLAMLMNEKEPDLTDPSCDLMNGWLNRINELMARTYVNTWSWANVDVETKEELNMVVFSSGIGDGAYTSYWGYDAHERLACLVLQRLACCSSTII